MKKMYWMISFGLALVPFCVNAHGASQARITFKLVDDEGKPVAGIPVVVDFFRTHETRGESDTNGILAVEGPADTWLVRYSAEKIGFYYSSGEYHFSESRENRWQPWDPVVTVTLRRVVKPVPMYAKRVSTNIPAIGGQYGYDLLAGDWVIPHGVGTNTDICLYASREIRSANDYTIQLRISNTNEDWGICRVRGIPESQMKMPRQAPLDGYEKEWVKELGIRDGRYFNIKSDPVLGLVCRVPKGNFADKDATNVCYAIIKGDVSVSGYLAERIHVSFVYVLNPTPNDRNLEFDPKQNLFKNLKATEQVTEP